MIMRKSSGGLRGDRNASGNTAGKKIQAEKNKVTKKRRDSNPLLMTVNCQPPFRYHDSTLLPPNYQQNCKIYSN